MYQRQGDNIITWCEAPPLIGEANNGVAAACGAAGVDLALSFQVRSLYIAPLSQGHGAFGGLAAGERGAGGRICHGCSCCSGVLVMDVVLQVC